MRATRLLREAISKDPKTVLDIAVGTGKHAHCFLAQGTEVTGLDVTYPPLEHENYEHIQQSYEEFALAKPNMPAYKDRKWDMIWCCHTLEHMPNVQSFLISLHEWLEEDGWLFIAVPPAEQNRLHIGHLSLWTPAHLVYNLICAGWDCRDARWYTEYCSIGLMLQNKPEIDLSWRSGSPKEIYGLNTYSPRQIKHNDGAWWGNNWHEETMPRVPDPPFVTVGLSKTNLPPETQLAFGPNPELRKGYER